MIRKILTSRLFSNNKNKKDVYSSRQNQMHYEMPTFHIENIYHYKINEEVPSDAVDFDLSNIFTNHFEDTVDFNKVPKLQHGLNKLLDGKIYSGDMGVGKIPKLQKELIAQISDYTPPSQDNKLFNLAYKHKCKYYSSTSSITIPMTHLYFILSMFRRPNFENIYEKDENSSIKKEYMNHFKKPASFYLTKKMIEGNTLYSIDADKGYGQQKVNEVLLDLGVVGQYLLTHSIETLQRSIQTKILEQKPESYYRHCLINNQILLRSQIDCRDIDQNGNPYVFEIKTRASCPIRYDIENWKLYLDYPINKLKGNYQSFEREYYDLIRGAFIKYALQIKIGRMNGAFIAYHNTQDIFGYEFVNFKEMVLRIFGDQYNLEASFQIISKMMTEIFDYIIEDTKEYDYEKLKIGFYANHITKTLVVFTQVMTQMKEYPEVFTKEGVFKYFQNYVKELKNPVFKYEFSFYTFLNGILMRHPEIYFTPDDNIRMKWKITKHGRVQKEDYIFFLREAYKEDFIFGSNKYGGSWSDIESLKKWC